MPFPRALILASAAAALFATASLAHAQTSPAQSPPARAQTVAGRALVIDGDTLEIRGQRIRLYGIAQVADDHVCTRTDDERWKCGPRAVNALDEFLEESIVTCMLREQSGEGPAAGSNPGPAFATCISGGTDLSLWLVRGGLATAAVPKYLKAQDEARAARRGLWELGAQRP